jgi:hypothetical protein
MIGERREKDAGQDRHRPLKACDEHKRKDLGLVADLGDADHHGRDEERFHRPASGSSAR